MNLAYCCRRGLSDAVFILFPAAKINAFLQQRVAIGCQLSPGPGVHVVRAIDKALTKLSSEALPW